MGFWQFFFTTIILSQEICSEIQHDHVHRKSLISVSANERTHFSSHWQIHSYSVRGNVNITSQVQANYNGNNYDSYFSWKLKLKNTSSTYKLNKFSFLILHKLIFN